MRKALIVASLALAAALALAAPAVAQDAPAEPDRRGGIILTYHLQDPALGLDGLSLEGDWHPEGSEWISVAGHLSPDGNASGFSGAGPRLHLPIGPVRLYGHYLLGDIAEGQDDGLNHRLGLGLEIPFATRGFVRFGPDHDGEQAHFSVGVGVRF